MRKYKVINNLTTAILFVSFSLITFSCNEGENIEKIAVRKCFDDYKNSITEDRYDKTTSFLDEKTLKYYDKIAEITLSGDSIEISKLKIIDQLAILLTRATADSFQIKKFDGKSLFRFSLENNFIEKEGMTNVWIGDVEIENNFAKGQMDSEKLKTITPDDLKRKKENPCFHFYREKGKWKLNLLSIMQQFEPAIQKSLTENSTSVPEFLFSVVEETTGTRPNSEIWNPITSK